MDKYDTPDKKPRRQDILAVSPDANDFPSECAPLLLTPKKSWATKSEDANPENTSLYESLVIRGGNTTGACALFLVFLMFAITTGLCPMIYQWSLYDPLTGQKLFTFIPCLPHALGHTLSCIAAALVTIIFERRKGLERLGNIRQVASVTPAAICNGCSDAGEVMAMKFLIGGVRAVCNQTRLPVIALVRRLCLGVKQSTQQVILILSISLAVASFILSTSEVGKEFNGLASGLLIAFVIILFGVGSSTTGEVLYKLHKTSLSLKIYQVRLASSAVLWICTSLGAVYLGRFNSKLFEGMNAKIIPLILFISFRDVFYIATLFYLDAFWNGLANSASVVVAFATDIVVFQQAFSSLDYCLVSLVLLLLGAYSIASPM